MRACACVRRAPGCACVTRAYAGAYVQARARARVLESLPVATPSLPQIGAPIALQRCHTDMQSKPEPILFLDDHRGVYIPRDFAECINRERIEYETGGRSLEHSIGSDLAYLAIGPKQEHYWETWESVLDHAVVTDNKGNRFTLYQDGALWLIPEGMSWSDSEEWFTWDDASEDDNAAE